MARKLSRINPVVRATGIISAVTVLVGGVTFAALQSQATLTDNTISSATAGLLVDSNNDDEFSKSEQGFSFEGILPGGDPSEPQTFSLQNSGETDMMVYASIMPGVMGEEKPEVMGLTEGDLEDKADKHLGDWGDWDAGLPEGVDARDVVFIFTAEGGESVRANWAKLKSSHGKQILANLSAGETQMLTVEVALKEDVQAEVINIAAFDFVFTGKAEAEVSHE